MSNTQKSSYTNVFVTVPDGHERVCGHKHASEIDALECCLAMKTERELVITYRDDDRGRWQYIGGWTLVEKHPKDASSEGRRSA